MIIPKEEIFSKVSSLSRGQLAGACTTSAVVSTLASFFNSSFHVSSRFWKSYPIRASGGSHLGPRFSGPWDWHGCPASAGGSRGARRRPGRRRAARPTGTPRDGRGRGWGGVWGFLCGRRGPSAAGTVPNLLEGQRGPSDPGRGLRDARRKRLTSSSELKSPSLRPLAAPAGEILAPSPSALALFPSYPPAGTRGVGVGGGAPRSRSSGREAVAERGGARG